MARIATDCTVDRLISQIARRTANSDVITTHIVALLVMAGYFSFSAERIALLMFSLEGGTTLVGPGR